MNSPGVLLSIKPKFADYIFAKAKTFEFRRAIFKREGVSKIYVYSSSPVKMVIGEFGVEAVITCNNKEFLWDITKTGAGCTKQYFDKYFGGREKVHAIKIHNAVLYEKPQTIERKFGLYVQAPQSFMYIGY